jgi:hypothetical protein
MVNPDYRCPGGALFLFLARGIICAGGKRGDTGRVSLHGFRGADVFCGEPAGSSESEGQDTVQGLPAGGGVHRGVKG